MDENVKAFGMMFYSLFLVHSIPFSSNPIRSDIHVPVIVKIYCIEAWKMLVFTASEPKSAGFSEF
jgi:hypothetical protein